MTMKDSARGRSATPERRTKASWDNAVKKQRRFDGPTVRLSRDEWEFICKHPCTYCGAGPACGIDRIDSQRKEYVWGNVVPCCTECNRAKGSMSVEAFLAWILDIADQLGLTNWGCCGLISDYSGSLQEKYQEAERCGQISYRQVRYKRRRG